MARQRPLGAFDRAQVLTNERHAYNISTVARLGGVPDEARLRAGLAMLVERHAMLRARITAGTERSFELTEATLPTFARVSAADAEDWTRIVERELAFEFDLGRLPLGRCVLLVDDAGTASDLVLTFPHTLVDGIAVESLLRQLLSFVAGGTLAGQSEEVADLPPSSDQVFPRRWQFPRRALSSLGFLARQLGDEISYRLATRGRHPRPPAGDFRCRILPLTLSREETRRIVRDSRHHRVGMPALLEAAMLVAVARHRHPGTRLPHRYCAFPLLRRYLDPPVDDDVVACFVTVLRLTARVSGEDDLWSLARRINRDLDQAMRRGDRFLAAVWSHFSMRTIFSQKSHRMATTAVSYTGATRLPEGVGDLELREIHAFVSNFPLGPEYTAQARIFRGRLCLDILYLDSDMSHDEAARIASTMRDLLLARGDGDVPAEVEGES